MGSSSENINFDDLINVDKIDFSNDETWLCAPVHTENKVDLKAWLYENSHELKDLEFHTTHLSLIKEITKLNSKQSIDTRTFTRPKKKTSRPSIEFCNESFNLSSALICDEDKVPNNEIGINSELPNFDLTQPVSSNVFDNILFTSKGLDSFINMSPPSLVNSTYAVSMDNNVAQSEVLPINNIDYSEQILLQDTEQPMFRSFTESCSSLNSDMQEHFLKKTLSSFNGTLKLQSSKDDIYKSLNNSEHSMDSNKEAKSNSVRLDETITGKTHESILDVIQSENIDPNATFTSKNNTTFRKTKNSKLNTTFDKSQQDILNVTYQKILPAPIQRLQKNNADSPNCMNVTYTESSNNNTFTKNSVSEDVCLTDSLHDEAKLLNLKKRNSFTIVNGKIGLLFENGQITTTIPFKEKMIDSPSGSVESLDRVSSLSNSSKGSSRILNMSEVDAIVEMQEQCLYGASTPLRNRNKSKLAEPKYFSIDNSVKNCKSESDLSSADEYVTVGSGLSNNSSTNSISRDIPRIEKQMKAINNEVIASNPRSFNTITKPIDRFNNGKMSNSNLTSLPVKIKGSLTNLKSIDSKLKGSYTSLKPCNTNLPHAPSLNAFVARPNQNIINNKTNIKVPSVTSDTVVQSKLKAPIKSQIKPSALPRPMATGIPRPTSRIPMPGFSRPASSKSSTRSISKSKDF